MMMQSDAVCFVRESQREGNSHNFAHAVSFATLYEVDRTRIYPSVSVNPSVHRAVCEITARTTNPCPHVARYACASTSSQSSAIEFISH